MEKVKLNLICKIINILIVILFLLFSYNYFPKSSFAQKLKNDNNVQYLKREPENENVLLSRSLYINNKDNYNNIYVKINNIKKENKLYVELNNEIVKNNNYIYKDNSLYILLPEETIQKENIINVYGNKFEILNNFSDDFLYNVSI